MSPDLSITHLDLDAATLNALRRCDVHTVGALAEKTTDELLSMYRIGAHRLAGIAIALAKLNLAPQGEPCQVWSDVDRYFGQALVPSDAVLDRARAAAELAGLPMHYAVSTAQGRLLELLVRIQRAERVLEVGTLAGYSTLWLARGLASGGRIVTLETRPDYAAVARSNFADAGLSEIIEVRVGAAVSTLWQLVHAETDPFDLVFIDADKANNATYLALALRLSRPGTLIVVDNVVRGGAVLDSEHPDPNVQGVRALVAAVHDDPRLHAVVVQTIGPKGHDGFLLAIVDTAVAPATDHQGKPVDESATSEGDTQ